MNDKLKAQIEEYINLGKPPTWIATALSIEDPEVDYDGVRAYAVQLQETVDYFKKKRQNLFAGTATMDMAQPMSESSEGSMESSGPGDEPPLPEEDPQLQGGEMPAAEIPTVEQLGQDYTEKLKQDQADLYQQLIESDEQLSASIQEINGSDATEAQKQHEVATLIRQRAGDKQKNLLQQYADEINNILPEGVNKTAYANKLYRDHGLAIPLDGNDRYNETAFAGGAVVDFFSDIGFHALASSIDFLSGPVSTIASQGSARLGLDPKPMKMSINKKMDDFANYLREDFTTQTTDTFTESLSDGDIGALISKSANTLAQSAPVIAGTIFTGGLATAVVSMDNAHTDSEAQDLAREQAGLEPIFDNTTEGKLARLGMSAVDGALTGFSGKIQASLVSRSVKELLRNNMRTEGKKQFFKQFALNAGLEIGSEGVIESSQEAIRMAFEDKLGNVDYTGEEYRERATEAFLLGISSSGLITAPTVASTAIEGTADLVRRPIAAAKSRVERAKMTDKDLDNIDSLNRSKGNPSQDAAAKTVEREKLFRMMALRHPADMKLINDFDLAIEQAVIRRKKAEEAGVTKEGLAAMDSDLKNLVKRREDIVKKHEGESTELTQQEQKNYDHARISNRVEQAKDRVDVLREELEVLKVESKIPFRVPEEQLIEVQEKVDAAVEFHKKAQKLIGDWSKANAEKSGVEAAIAELKNHLGILDIETKAKPQQKPQYSAAAQLENHMADPESKGSTFTLDGVNQAGRDKASVSIFPERSKIVDGDITAEDLEAYVSDNKSFFEGNEDVLSVGTWFDAKENKTYIDVAATLDRDIAVELGKQYNQKAVWDLKTMEEIDTGGTGVAEGDLKPEADRIGDIRNLVKGPDTEVEGDKKVQEPEQVQEQDRSVRGIEGEFDTYQAKEDGSLGITSLPGLTKKELRFINKNLAKSLSKVVGNNYKIVAHRTTESGDKMSLQQELAYNAMAVNNSDGSVEIHLSLPRMADSRKAGKSPISILIEENLHVVLGPAIRNSLSNDPKKVFKLIDGLEKEAKASGNEQIVKLVEEKGKAYKEVKDADQAEVLEEQAIEYLSELISLDFENETILDRVRVKINQFLSAVLGKDAVLIEDISQAKVVLKKLKQSMRTGEGFAVADANSSKDVERASLSPAKLPETEPFTVRFARVHHDRTGAEMPAKFDQRVFNGKWHFINWWKKATGMGVGMEPGSRVAYRSFSLIGEGGATQPIDTDVMRKWKMRPPVFKRDAQKIAREKDSRKRNIIPNYFAEVNKKRTAEGGAVAYASGTYRAALTDLEQVLSEPRMESLKLFKDRLQENGVNESQIAYKAFYDFAKLEEVESARDKFLSDNNLSDSDLTTERAAYALTKRIQEDPVLSNRFEQQIQDKAAFLCGVGGGTCAANDKSSLLQAESSLIKSKIGENPSLDASINIAAQSLDVLRQHVIKDHGIDLADAVQNYAEGRSEVMKSISDLGDIRVDPNDFEIMYDLLVAYTSNGSTIDPNLALAKQLFVSGLRRIQSGADSFIRPGRIEALRKREDSGTLGLVNGGRANNMADHLIGINKIYSQFFRSGVFDKTSFDAAVKRDETGESPLREMIGIETTKLANLALGNRGDADAIPMDGHFRDQFNIYRGRFKQTDFSEGLVIPEMVRTSAVDRINALGGNVTTLSADSELFAEIKKLKAEGDVATKNSAARIYKDLVGNQIEKLRSFNKATMAEAAEFVKGVAKTMDLTPFQVQQLMYHDGIYSMSSYQGKPFISDYRSAMIRSNEADVSSVDLDAVPGEQLGLAFPDVDPITESIMPTPGPKLVTKLGQAKAAESNQLFRYRDALVGNTVRVNKAETRITDNMVQEALSTDATSRRIMGKGVEVEPGRKVGVRLNLNVRKNTGVPVQTLHDKTASGEALQYAAGVTVKNAELFVNQNAREKIVTFQENKFPMASVNGEFVASGTDLNYDGVKAFFDPFRHNVFVDAAGRPIKSAGEATVVGSVAYLRGDIEYYAANDPVLKRGSVESEASRIKRTTRGPKYDKALKRFEGYSKFVLGQEYATRSDLEQAYDNMVVASDVSITDSDVAAKMGEAVERASISKVTKVFRQGVKRVAATQDPGIRQEIIKDPRNYITPQNLKDLKRDVQDLSDQELIDIVSDEQLGRISTMNDNLSVLAQAERLARAVARGEADRIPDLVAEIGAMGTTAGRLLRHFREVKKASPKGLAATIKAAAEAKGNKMSAEREAQLNQITSRLFQQQSIVEDLMSRAIAGEKVGKDLEAEVNRLKAIEKELDTFTNVNIERGWGELLGQIAQGNLLTTMSQMTNIGANAVNSVFAIGADLTSTPVRGLMRSIASLSGKEYDVERKPALGAYLYAMSHMGRNMVDTMDQVITGQDKGEVEWRQSRSLMPFRSMIAALNETDVPTSQRMKLLVQGTLGLPAEVMFRALSFGDIPFRKFFEDKNLYEQGIALGLEGEALADFLKHPPRKAAANARTEGRRITFQEETGFSRAVTQGIAGIERGIGGAINAATSRVDGDQAAKFLMRMMVPFRSTPANILIETATYASPVVAAMRASAALKDGNIDQASQHVAKGMIGAVVSEVAVMLMAEGLMSGVIQWDEDEEKNLAYDQFPPTSINISALQRFLNGQGATKMDDDVFMNYMKLGTPGALMAAISSAYDKEELRERDYAGPVDFARYAFNDMAGIGPLSAAGGMMEQSFMQGVNEFLQTLIGTERERSAERLLNSLGGVAMSIVLPNQASALYRANREYLPDRRVTKDMNFTERLMANLEYTIKDRTFRGSEIPIRHDWKGQPIKQNPRGNQGWMYQLFDITKIRQGEEDAVSQEIYRLYEELEEVSSVVSTPSFAKKRKLSVPNIKNKKEIRALRSLGKKYSFLDDQEFVDSGVYLNTEQLNRLMAIAGQERYAETQELINSYKYELMSDEKKLEALNDINKNYSSAKEYDGRRFKNHTIALLDIMQQIYEREKED